MTMFISTLLLSLISLAACDSAQCAIQFDGRVPKNTPLAAFDTSASLFNPKFVFGQNLSWSEILLFPTVPPSLFDKNCSKAVEVTISDDSIFASQKGFRRAELLPIRVNGSDPSTLGVKTLHFSLMKDSQRPLNLSHEYQLVFLESADFSTNQFVLKAGSILGETSTADPDTLTLFGNVNSVPPQSLFKTTFSANTFHNFGLKLDFTQNTTQVLYSTNNSCLANVTGPQPNDLSGRGQYHFGVLKKPTGNVADVVHEGFQETDINEGITYGGIFMEDSTNGCVSLS